MEQNIHVAYKDYNAFTNNELWRYLGRFELALLKEKGINLQPFVFFVRQYRQTDIRKVRNSQTMDEILQQIIDGCRKGERASQVALYRRYAKWLYNICLRIVVNPADAEEAMQDTFLKAFASMAHYEGGVFEGWLKQIAVHVAIDALRRKKEEWEELPDNYPLTDDDEGVDEEAIHLQVETVRKAIAELPTGYRVVLSLYLFEGYDMEEIASILQLKPASVRSQYLRGKQKLLNILQQKNG